MRLYEFMKLRLQHLNTLLGRVINFLTTIIATPSTLKETNINHRIRIVVISNPAKSNDTVALEMNLAQCVLGNDVRLGNAIPRLLTFCFLLAGWHVTIAPNETQDQRRLVRPRVTASKSLVATIS